MNCLVDGPFSDGEMVEEALIWCDLVRVQEDWRDWHEFVGALLVVDQSVVVEGVDDIGDG